MYRTAVGNWAGYLKLKFVLCIQLGPSIAHIEIIASFAFAYDKTRKQIFPIDFGELWTGSSYNSLK